MTDNPQMRVLIVDDHAVVRSGLSAFLLAFDDLELIGDAASGAERSTSRSLTGTYRNKAEKLSCTIFVARNRKRA